MQVVADKVKATRRLAIPVACVAWGVGLVAGAPQLAAQGAGAHQGAHATPPGAARPGSVGADAADPSHAVHDAMSRDMHDNPHLRMSPRRVATAADSARAAKVVADARVALARYKDVRVAERDGYTMFAPNVKDQPVYHFTKTGAAIRAQFRFDATKPTSLLYRRDSAGRLRLVGAMYTAPRDATSDELNSRIPLGIARWHLHTNMCVPRLGQWDRWRELEGGRPVFGPASPVATREACEALDGRFLPVVFNWMVHANVYEDEVWGDHH